MKYKKAWRRLLKSIRERFPTGSPVIVSRYPAKKNCGRTRFDGHKFLIRIDSSQEWQSQADALLHEWAHIQAIEQSYSHGPVWSNAYSAIYRWHIEEPNEN
jgi:hypothetical protein